MIAVLTKYEALVDRVKLKFNLKGRKATSHDILSYTNKEVLGRLKAIQNKPAAIVQTHRKLFINYNNKSNNIKAL